MEIRYNSQMLMVILLMCGSVVRCDDGAVDENEDVDTNNYAKRQMPLWYGPRLGRNKRTDYDVTVTSSADNSPQSSLHDNILDILRDSTWALIPINSGGSERNLIPNFVQRLGRTEDDEEAMEASRSPPFAPRLGRRRHVFAQFAPRLGRGPEPVAQH